MRHQLLIVAILGALPMSLNWAASAPADEPDSTEQVAARLMATTLTLRVSHAIAAPIAPAGGAPADVLEKNISVCSGVSLGPRLIVTALGQEIVRSFAVRSTDPPQARVTLPDGRQAVAWARVVDEYAGLGLFEAEGVELPALELADALPAVGAHVLAASAAGIDRPVVSQGILSGIDRTLAGSTLPPLLQCDVRTTETTGGAPLVDRRGRLIGVVTAVAPADRAGGWTYAVPLRHIERLLAARNAEQLVILRRQRPSLGLRLAAGAEDGVVVVEHVEPTGPAAAAGLAAGDVILETDGRRIRSAYQAVMLVLKKQPGDDVDFLVARGEQIRRVQVLLGGAAEGAAAPMPTLNLVRIGPQLKVRARPNGRIEVENQARVEELSTGNAEPAPAADQTEAEGEDPLALLRKQLEAFTQVICQLQDELVRRDQAQAQYEERLKALTAEVERLRAELAAAHAEQQQPPVTAPPTP